MDLQEITTAVPRHTEINNGLVMEICKHLEIPPLNFIDLTDCIMERSRFVKVYLV